MGSPGKCESQLAGSETTGAKSANSEFCQFELTQSDAAEMFTAGATGQVPASGEHSLSSPACVSPGELLNSSAAQLPSVASSILVPPLPGASEQQAGSEPGGEWELLLSKWQTWWTSGELIALASQARKPLLLIAGLLALLLVLLLYAGLLAALESLPLLPGLLELVAVIWLVRYGGPRLLHRDERQRLIAALASRWRGFLGG